MNKIRNNLKQNQKDLIKEQKWEKEFEGSLNNLGSYEGGIYFCNKNSLEDLIKKYLKVLDESYPHNENYNAPKVKIKVRKGAILIEKINE